MPVYKTENKFEAGSNTGLTGSLTIENTGKKIIFSVDNGRGDKAAAVLSEYEAAELTAWLMKLF